MFLRVARYLIAAAMIAGAYYSAVFARAGYLFAKDTAESVRAAVNLAPYNSAYVARLGAWEPQKKTRLLQRAVELNPFDYQSWIQLGLDAEVQQHDVAAAERDYLKAAEVDHMFLPKWTLTNFYFRQQNEREFFRWAKATLAITPLSAEPVFGEMWLMSQDAEKIASVIPARAGVLLEYLLFLSNARRDDALPEVVNRVIATARGHDPAKYGRDDHMGPVEDRLLGAGEAGPALAIWKSMSDAGWVRLPVPDTEHPLTNGSFTVPFFSHGFDWMPLNAPGVSVEQSAAEKTLYVTLSGSEDERCGLLRQYVVLDPGSSYRLAWRAEAQPGESVAGLHWRVSAVPDDGATIASGDLLRPGGQAWEFKPEGPGKVHLLTLEYSRRTGEVRANGGVAIRSVTLTRMQ